MPGSSGPGPWNNPQTGTPSQPAAQTAANTSGNRIMGIGSGVFGQLVGTGLGLLLEGHNDRRQLEQQQKLNYQAYQTNTRFAEEDMARQLQMWKDTNYSAQVAELEKAGLNPGLMYGMSGGGATTAGGSRAMGVGAGNAPTGGREVLEISQMLMQRQMMEAQIELVKAQASKTRAEQDKLTGIDTQVGEATFANITQGIENQKAQKLLTEGRTKAQGIANNMAEDTFETMVAQSEATLQNLKTQGDLMENELGLQRETYDERVQQIGANLAKTLVDKLYEEQLIKASKTGQKLDEQLINESKQKITASIIAGQQKAAEISIEQGLAALHNMTDFQKTIADGISKIGQALGISIATKGLIQPRTEISGFKARY